MALLSAIAHPYHRVLLPAPTTKPDREGQRCAGAVLRARRLVWNREWAREASAAAAETALTDSRSHLEALRRARYRHSIVANLLSGKAKV